MYRKQVCSPRFAPQWTVYSPTLDNKPDSVGAPNRVLLCVWQIWMIIIMYEYHNEQRLTALQVAESNYL